MKTKSILSIAIIAALPITVNAQNISGAMYTAPTAADTNHPAPTTQANAPYGRIDIDTADQEHIATTAYVKGAYNSAIAAVNKAVNNLDESKQNTLVLLPEERNFMSDVVISSNGASLFGSGIRDIFVMDASDYGDAMDNIRDNLSEQGLGGDVDEVLVTAGAVLEMLHEAGNVVKEIGDNTQVKLTTRINNQDQSMSSNVLSGINDASATTGTDKLVTAAGVVNYVNSKTVPIYTTWDTNNTTNVHLQ